MKVMKVCLRVLTAALLLGALTISLSACGNKKFKCDLCMEEKTGKSHTLSLYGEKATLCDECFKEMKDFASGF